MRRNRRTARSSIWSVLTRFRPIYATLFSALWSLGAIVSFSLTESWPDLISALAAVTITAGTASMILTDVVGGSVMLTEWLADVIERKKEERKRKDEGALEERDRQVREATIEDLKRQGWTGPPQEK